jgi:hypothetical protein
VVAWPDGLNAIVAVERHAPLTVRVGAALNVSSESTRIVTTVPARAAAGLAVTVRFGGVASNGAIESLSVALLSLESGSGMLLETLAVFESVPVAVTLSVALTTNVAVPPLATVTLVAIDPLPLAAGQLEPDEAVHVQLTPLRTAGKVSLTVAPVTALGPPLLTTSVYLTTEPGTAMVWLSVFVMDRSADGVGLGVAVAVDVLVGVGVFVDVGTTGVDVDVASGVFVLVGIGVAVGITIVAGTGVSWGRKNVALACRLTPLDHSWRRPGVISAWL